jgi:hypothetical protein
MATNKKLNPLDEKFKKDELKFKQITNKDLICKDCKKKYDDTNMPCNTSKCEAFNVKPDEVLDGGDCIEYENA